ncbi:MAG: TetR/AcrR family transcriptional regulator [Aquirhabdus sp.]
MIPTMTDTPTLSRAERNRLQLRADIIQAAFEEFSAKGYHQTAISDIAKRLGIGHGTFYRHFQNKRDILEHVINDVTTKIVNVLSEENAPNAAATLEDYREQISRIIERLIPIMIENPGIARLMLFEATSIDPEMTQRLMTILDWGGRLTASYMENGVKLGFFRADLDTEATGHAVIGMIMMTVIRFLNTPDDRAGQQKLVNAIQRLAIDGLVKK